MGELALVGDHSTVPLTRISCNTVFSKSQNARKAGTLSVQVFGLRSPLYYNHTIAYNSTMERHVFYLDGIGLMVREFTWHMFNINAHKDSPQ